ncbi:RAMP superfamily CRISPR-associated protein [Veillonella criceti]|uniref:CRISPR-associated RAMP protein, SSO1426 family n=1 Tax=Veillonella criceti TaxID=103891 RepID=A0A380NKD9_9FIRM|nr:RAMP superfamily CRISPR-associated protein [Veillonella criceti]SUP43061.1 CRISPR-associated RAMP protein, SSO1426 family [Veillonella criceti]
MNEASVIQKIKIEGTVELMSPLIIGAGDGAVGASVEVDSQVVKDKAERPFIPGTSLAGALRHWAWNTTNSTVALKDELDEDFDEVGISSILFGDFNSKIGSTQSAIIINDIVLEDANIVFREGVAIDSVVNVGIDGHKYDFEVVERGATGKLHIEITLRRVHENYLSELEQLIKTLVDQLKAGIRLGGSTTKGFGKIASSDITAYFYDFSKFEEVKQWLCNKPSSNQYEGSLSNVSFATNTFYADIEGRIDSSLIIRDYGIDFKGEKINAVQFKSGKNGHLLPTIPGTTVKGVLRKQAEYICRRLGIDESKLDPLMGIDLDFRTKQGAKSRFIVDEVYISEGVKEVKQSRIRVDRFTGGVIDSALFTNIPLWQEKESGNNVKIHFEIERCQEWEAGLALCLIKDICTGRIPFGGEKSIGKGRIIGESVNIRYDGQEFNIKSFGENNEDDSELLNLYLEEFASLGEGV